MSLIGGTAVDLGDMAVTAGLSTVGSMAGASLGTAALEPFRCYNGTGMVNSGNRSCDCYCCSCRGIKNFK